MSRPALFHIGVFAIVLLLAIPLAVWARENRPFGPETRVSDLWFRSRPTRDPRPDIIIVARDQKTLDAMRPTHADYASLIRRLKDAGAKWIVLDLDLDDRQGHAADEALWKAIQESHRTLVMIRYDQARSGEPDKDDLRGLRALERSVHWQELELRSGTPVWDWLQFAPATSDFIHSAHGAGVAVTEQSLDPDSVLRRSRAGYLTTVLYPADEKQGKLTNLHGVVPSLPVITAVSALGGDKYALDYRFGERLSLGGIRAQPLTVGGFTPIDYIGPDGTYPRVSMVDVLRSQPDERLFRDRIVLVGSTAPGDDLTEARVTPFGSRMPRVEVTANQVQAILENRKLAEPHVAGFWGVLMLGVLLAAVTPAFRGGWVILGSLLALVLYLVVGWAAFVTRSVMVPLLPALFLMPLAMLITFAMESALRPYTDTVMVQTRDTGMAVGPDEELPVEPRRRWPVWRPRNRA
jgi:CHASE2 domain-containing sensor protein